MLVQMTPSVQMEAVTKCLQGRVTAARARDLGDIRPSRSENVFVMVCPQLGALLTPQSSPGNSLCNQNIGWDTQALV